MNDPEQYITCLCCGKEKYIHKGEFIKDHDNVIFYPNFLKDYDGWCLRCQQNDVTSRLKFMWASQYEAKGEKVPQWVLDYGNKF